MLAPSIPRFVETSKPDVSTTSGISLLAPTYNYPMVGRPRKAESAATRDPFAVKIGERISRGMEKKKWKLRDLARHTGLEIKRLGNYKTGERMPGPAEILAIGTALGESPAYLMGLVDSVDPDIAETADQVALLILYRTVDPEDRKKTLDRLGAIALLKKEAIQDAELEHLSAKGKPLHPDSPSTRPRRRRSETERGS